MKWERDKKKENVKVMPVIKDEISEWDRWVDGVEFLLVERKPELLELESQRMRILARFEAT